jgi:hypothetical protein
LYVSNKVKKKSGKPLTLLVGGRNDKEGETNIGRPVDGFPRVLLNFRITVIMLNEKEAWIKVIS